MLQKNEYRHARRDRLKARRIELGMTQAQLAKKIGVKLGTVSSWERGESSPGSARLLGLMDALDLDGVSVIQVLEG